jgi:hypothetical protein
VFVKLLENGIEKFVNVWFVLSYQHLVITLLQHDNVFYSIDHSKRHIFVRIKFLCEVWTAAWLTGAEDIFISRRDRKDFHMTFSMDIKLFVNRCNPIFVSDGFYFVLMTSIYLFFSSLDGVIHNVIVFTGILLRLTNMQSRSYLCKWNNEIWEFMIVMK